MPDGKSNYFGISFCQPCQPVCSAQFLDRFAQKRSVYLRADWHYDEWVDKQVGFIDSIEEWDLQQVGMITLDEGSGDPHHIGMFRSFEVIFKATK